MLTYVDTISFLVTKLNRSFLCSRLPLGWRLISVFTLVLEEQPWTYRVSQSRRGTRLKNNVNDSAHF
jgi:hypothetical protein